MPLPIRGKGGKDRGKGGKGGNADGTVNGNESRPKDALPREGRNTGARWYGDGDRFVVVHARVSSGQGEPMFLLIVYHRRGGETRGGAGAAGACSISSAAALDGSGSDGVEYVRRAGVMPARACEAHSSSGLGRRPLKAEITGSNPVCATKGKPLHLGGAFCWPELRVCVVAIRGDDIRVTTLSLVSVRAGARCRW